jgi:hypothetical protein
MIQRYNCHSLSSDEPDFKHFAMTSLTILDWLSIITHPEEQASADGYPIGQ